MNLKQLGWSPFLEQQSLPEHCIPARVSGENKNFYRVIAVEGEFLAKISGRLSFQLDHRSGFPVVGDWAAIQTIGKDRAIIQHLFPRITALSRKTAGKSAEQQLVCSNMDYVFVMSSMNQEFSSRRLERYLSIAWESGATPVVILTKADLCANEAQYRAEAEIVSPGVAVHIVSAVTGRGMEIFSKYLSVGTTGVFIGSSGVGKSTILNAISGQSFQKTLPVRESDDRGRHTTTSRQMILIPEKGIIVDTPGMRELGLWDTSNGLSQTFQDLESIAEGCGFRDCKHRDEPRCAVRQAAESGELNFERLESYRKLQAEILYLEAKTDTFGRLNRKARAKRSCKAQKQIYKSRRF
jgi:ribosome biogenesis GTPase